MKQNKKLTPIVLLMMLIILNSGCSQQSDKCDLNKDGALDSIEKDVCEKPANINPQPMSQPDKCDLNKDGILDSIEKGVCVKPINTNPQPLPQKVGAGSSNQSSGSGAKAVFQQSFPPTKATEEFDFHKMAGNNWGGAIKLFNPALDSKNHRLYVVGSKTTEMVVIDTLKDEVVDSFDIGFAGGFLIFNSGKIYVFDFIVNTCHSVDPASKKTENILVEHCTSILPNDKDKPQKWGKYLFLETGYQRFPDGSTGFPTDWTQDMNGAYGVIEISDEGGNNLGRIVHGPDSLYFLIDSTQNKIYTTNSGDGSVSVFDLNKLEETNYCQDNACKIKDIDVGTSGEEVLVDSHGRIYLKSRLGGSTIYIYDQISTKFNIVDNENNLVGGIGMWPAGMGLSSDETRLYILSHYSARIDVVDTNTYKVIGNIQFNTELKPRTDSISAMVFDKSREKLYAVFPELGVIGIADGRSEKVLGMIDLTKYGFEKKANGGPGLVKLSVNEKTDTLSVLLSRAKTQLYFDGTTLEPKRGASDKPAGQLAYHNDKTGASYQVATINAGPGKSQQIIYETINGTKTKQWVSDIVVSGIPPGVFFDFNNNALYISCFETAVVTKYDLSTTGDAVTGPEFFSPNQETTPPTQRPPRQQFQGSCGDGVCGPVEEENGVCPEDCR